MMCLVFALLHLSWLFMCVTGRSCNHKTKMKGPPLVNIRHRKCKSVKPLPPWRGHITAAPDPQNENACQCSFELGDRLHLQRVIRFMTVKAIKDNSAVRRLATSTGQESTCGSEEENDIWEEVTKMLRMNRGEEGLQTHHEP